MYLTKYGMEMTVRVTNWLAIHQSLPETFLDGEWLPPNTNLTNCFNHSTFPQPNTEIEKGYSAIEHTTHFENWFPL